MKNKTILISGFVFLTLFLITNIIAAGVSSFYSEDTPLKMYIGEEKTIEFNLQNMVGEEDVTFKVEIKQGSDIASLEKDTYFVKAKTYDTMVPLKIIIPSNFSKTSEKIELEFKTITPGESGGILMGITYGVSFDVIPSEKPKETPKINSSAWITTIVIILLIILIVIVALVKRKK